MSLVLCPHALMIKEIDEMLPRSSFKKISECKSKIDALIILPSQVCTSCNDFQTCAECIFSRGFNKCTPECLGTTVIQKSSLDDIPAGIFCLTLFQVLAFCVSLFQVLAFCVSLFRVQAGNPAYCRDFSVSLFKVLAGNPAYCRDFKTRVPHRHSPRTISL